MTPERKEGFGLLPHHQRQLLSGGKIIRKSIKNN
jgi:hypothetical protein